MEESEDETADSDAEGEAEEAPESKETEGEDEEEPEVEEEAEESEAEEETAEETEEDEYHIEDADDVYQDEAVAGVLHLDLEGLFLDLLGLEVNLNPVTLDVSARPGENNLLGNLLAAVSGLFDGSSGMLETVASLLNKPGEFLDALFGGRVPTMRGKVKTQNRVMAPPAASPAQSAGSKRSWPRWFPASPPRRSWQRSSVK